MTDVLIKSTKTEAYKKKHILTGGQGIGKSITLLLLVDKFKKNKQLKVVYLPNCFHIMERGWIPIVEEFMFTFPNEREELQRLLSQKKKPSENEIISVLEEILKKSIEQNEIPIFVLDQINFILSPNVYSIFEKLTYFPWRLQIYSQSANNQIQKELKFFEIHMVRRMIPVEGIKEFIKNKKEFQDLKCIESDIEKVINLVGTTPREVERIFETTGNTLNQKIFKYKTTRRLEILQTHNMFKSSLNNFNQIQLFESIYIMDLDITSTNDMQIDQQLMIKEFNPETSSFKIKSSFPYAGFILKETLEMEAIKFDKDFFHNRIANLNEWIKDISLPPGCRGSLYEEMIHTSFQRSFQNKEKINLVGHPANYLKYADNHNLFTEVIL